MTSYLSQTRAYNDAASTAEVTQSLILYVFIDTRLIK
jgi:hypothetical protein